VVLSLPIVVDQLFSNARDIKEQTEVILPEGGVLTSKPLTLTAKTQSENSPLLSTGRKVAHPPVSMLDIYTGPITYTEDFSVNVYMNTESADGATSIKDSNLLGSFSLPPDLRRRNEGGQGDRTIPFPMITGAHFYKLLEPGKPFSVILVPVGRAAADPDFRIPVRRIDLTVIGGSWWYRFLRSRPR
jgi:hypothetical protein